LVDFVWVPCLALLSTSGCVFMLVKKVYFLRFVVPHVVSILFGVCCDWCWVGKTVQCAALNFVYSCGPVGLFDDCAMCWFVFVCDEVVPMTLSSDCNIVVSYSFLFVCSLNFQTCSFLVFFWSICRTHNV